MKRNIAKTLIIGLIILFVGASVTSGISINIADNNPDKKVGMPPNWFERFDTYTDGQFLDGGADDGGWKGWDNDPAFGATVTSEQFLSEPHSVRIEPDSDFVHEFAGIYTEGVWNFSYWVFVPDDFEGQSSPMILDQYADGEGAFKHWATYMILDSFESAFISMDGGYYLPLITGQWVEIINVIDLDTDWWDVYYNGQLLDYREWTAGWDSDMLGVLDIGAIDLFGNGATPVYYDDISITEFGLVTGPDLAASGSLNWPAAPAGGTLTGEIIVANAGAEDSMLDWEIESFPDFGTWTFDPSGGEDLVGSTTVEVTVVAPGEDGEFAGEVKIVNTEDSEDFVIIPVSIVTPKSKSINTPFIEFLEQHPRMFPLLRHLIGL